MFETISTSDLLKIDLLKPEETAKVIGISINTLKRWRTNPEHPLKWIKLGQKMVRYRVVDVMRFIIHSPDGNLQK